MRPASPGSPRALTRPGHPSDPHPPQALTRPPHPAADGLRLPVGRRAARAVVLAAVFVCAACGLVYELALVALGSYLIGDTVGQTAIVLSVMICAMGVGALAAKRAARRPVLAFAAVEGLLALVGGLSVLTLYAAFAWLSLYTPALVVIAAAVGTLIGAEIPVLMTLIQRIQAQDASEAVADLSAADYVGALVGGLAFPFVLLPALGQLKGALVVGAVNACAALLVVGWLFGRELTGRTRLAVGVGFAAVLAVLGLAGASAGRFEVSARQALYDDPIVHARRSAYQDIVVTDSRWPGAPRDVRLYLNGDLQFSSVDEYRYHEALVHPAMAGRRERVLVLGGGDGLAVREVLRYPDVADVVLVELDPAVLDLARSRLATLNDGALGDDRLDVVVADAFSWLRSAPSLAGGPFDVVLIDLPDPDSTATAKLYSVEFYGLVSSVLAPGGRVAVQAGSPYFAPEAFWCVDATLSEAGMTALPYHVDVPSFGDWGFVLAARDTAPALGLDSSVQDSLRFLDAPTLLRAVTFPRDRRRLAVEPSTLLDPVILEYSRRGWRTY